MKTKHYRIKKITYHYLADSSDGTSSSPCLNVFFEGKHGKSMVAMINPLWSEIRFMPESEYKSGNYKDGFTINDLSEIDRTYKFE